MEEFRNCCMHTITTVNVPSGSSHPATPISVERNGWFSHELHNFECTHVYGMLWLQLSQWASNTTHAIVLANNRISRRQYKYLCFAVCWITGYSAPRQIGNWWFMHDFNSTWCHFACSATRLLVYWIISENHFWQQWLQWGKISRDRMTRTKQL